MPTANPLIRQANPENAGGKNHGAMGVRPDGRAFMRATLDPMPPATYYGLCRRDALFRRLPAFTTSFWGRR